MVHALLYENEESRIKEAHWKDNRAKKTRGIEYTKKINFGRQ